MTLHAQTLTLNKWDLCLNSWANPSFLTCASTHLSGLPFFHFGGLMCLTSQFISSGSHTYLHLSIAFPRELRFWLRTPICRLTSKIFAWLCCLTYPPNAVMYPDKALFLVSLSLENCIEICFWILWHFLGKPFWLSRIIHSQPDLPLSLHSCIRSVLVSDSGLPWYCLLFTGMDL